MKQNPLATRPLARYWRARSLGRLAPRERPNLPRGGGSPTDHRSPCRWFALRRFLLDNHPGRAKTTRLPAMKDLAPIAGLFATLAAVAIACASPSSAQPSAFETFRS